MRIGIVVGEVSGDKLARSLVDELKKIYPQLEIEGIGGPLLIEAGCKSLFPMERLSVMGLVEPLKRLPELIKIRRQLIKYFKANPPDVFIGIDSPDFTLGLEKQLKAEGIKTVHYVCPSVWAWRQGRIKTIRQATDLMLTLFPFEADFCQNHQVPATCVGHHMADSIPLAIQTEVARSALSLPIETKIIGLMPGSRDNELRYLAESYFLTAKWCYEKEKSLHFIVPVVSKAHQEQLLALKEQMIPEIPVTVVVDATKEAIAASDVVLVTSGTATLEVMLYKKPMVVAYRMHPISYFLLKLLVKVPYISLPNLIAKKGLVPEYIQGDVIPDKMGQALLDRLQPGASQPLIETFRKMHHSLKKNASEKAAAAIAGLIESSRSKQAVNS